MILPNKLISFKDCILAKTIYILEKISDSDFSVIELYEKVETHFEDLNEYMLALDVLYVLGEIKYDEELRVIQYVKKIICDIFLQKEIIFYEGLNAIVGDDVASNSIGKSTMLMIIDFVFGGDDYINKNHDVVDNLGHHDFRFIFNFNNKDYFLLEVQMNTNLYLFVMKNLEF